MDRLSKNLNNYINRERNNKDSVEKLIICINKYNSKDKNLSRIRKYLKYFK